MINTIQVKVRATISTDFFIEVPENVKDPKKIRELAEKEVILPHTYPTYIDNLLKTRMGINIRGIDSMLKSWNIDNIEYSYDGETSELIGSK